MAAEDLVASAWSQSQTKNVSLLTGILSSRLEEKGKDYSRTPKSLFMKASRVVLRGGVYGGGPSPMERPSFARIKTLILLKVYLGLICFPRHFVEIFKVYF